MTNSERGATISSVDWRAVGAYVALACGLAWTAEGIALAQGVRFTSLTLAATALLAAVMVTPAIAAFIVRRFITREGFATAGLRFGPRRPYLVVWLGVPLLVVGIYALTVLLGLGRFDPTLAQLTAKMEEVARGQPIPALPSPLVLATAMFAQSLTFGVLITSLFTFGEEFGWTGYLLVRLLPLGRWRAALLYGAIWGLWHAPIIAGGFNYPGYPVLGPVMMCLLTIAFALTQTALRLRYDSVYLTSFFHASINTHGLGIFPMFVAGVSPILGGVTGIVGIVTFMALGVWLLARTPESQAGRGLGAPDGAGRLSAEMPRLALIVPLMLLAAACGSGTPESMAIGSPAPAFTLQGTDGKAHSLSDYADSRVLAVVFTCNHCPASQLYEARIAKLYEDYRNQGVAVVAINPDNPKALRLDELSHTDVGESLDDMKTRAEHRRLDYPYLSGGETVAKQFKVVATPQIFVFDKDRALRYQGRIDNQVREDAVTSRDARNAIDALLAGRPVPVANTTAVGCPPTFLSKPGGPEAEQAAIAAEPVTLDMVGADGLKKLRQNGTGKLLMINFWATWCAPCVTEFPDLEATYRMYRGRGVDFVAVSTNDPEEKPGVIEFLQKHHSSHRNLQFATSDVYELQAAFDPAMPAALPFTLLLAPNGDVLFQELGAADIPKLRRAILANLPDDKDSAGQQAYWSRK